MFEDHPRSCGKDALDTVKKLEEQGSPPLVRERRFEIYDNSGVKRITPARAGKTLLLTTTAI